MSKTFNNLIEDVKSELSDNYQSLIANSGGSRADLISTFF